MTFYFVVSGLIRRFPAWVLLLTLVFWPLHTSLYPVCQSSESLQIRSFEYSGQLLISFSIKGSKHSISIWPVMEDWDAVHQNKNQLHSILGDCRESGVVPISFDVERSPPFTSRSI